MCVCLLLGRLGTSCIIGGLGGGLLIETIAAPPPPPPSYYVGESGTRRGRGEGRGGGWVGEGG